MPAYPDAIDRLLGGFRFPDDRESANLDDHLDQPFTDGRGILNDENSHVRLPRVVGAALYCSAVACRAANVAGVSVESHVLLLCSVSMAAVWARAVLKKNRRTLKVRVGKRDGGVGIF